MFAPGPKGRLSLRLFSWPQESGLSLEHRSRSPAVQPVLTLLTHIPLASLVIKTLNQIFLQGSPFWSQNCAMADHCNSECSVNCHIATGISIPDVGIQRLNWVLFALLTDTLLLESQRFMGLQEVTHNLRGVYCPRSVTASHSTHSCNGRDILGHVFPALSNLHKFSHKSSYS